MSGNMSKSPFFEGGASLRQGRVYRPPTSVGVRKLYRVIAVSCGIKMSAVHYLALSQYTRLTDRQTDGRTDRQTELRQQYRALHYTQSHGKKMKNRF